jgi:ribosomal protein S18 acetylase RimI-like enzyme
VITVTPAQPEHAEAIAEMTEEMDRFYGATTVEPVKLRIRQIYEALFGDAPSAHMLLSWNDGKLVGFASYSFLWPAVGLSRSLYLKELYVSSKVRRAGVGKLLMQRLFDIAVQNDCSRVEWTADADNREAQLFYDELGVPVKESKLFYRIESNELGHRLRAL